MCCILVLLAKLLRDVANKVSKRRDGELKCLYCYHFPRKMGNVGNSLLLFPQLLLEDV